MSIYKLPDLSKFPDCCALTEKGRCTRLALYICQGNECTFKQTRKEGGDSLQHVYQRISSLDISKQMHIAQKYYGGTMPWKDVETANTYKAYER
jgi:Tfp pilus assembly PilM family ATPase